MLTNRNKRITTTNNLKITDNNVISNEKSKKPQQINKIIAIVFAILVILVILYESKPINTPKQSVSIRVPIPKQHPSLIIVASVNGGTSTFNQILMHQFKHFFHGFRTTQDMYYWLACIPKDFLTHIGISPLAVSNYTFTQLFNTLKQKPSADFKTWDANFNKLRFFGCENFDNPYHCNLKCKHNDYMQHIGFNKDGYNKYKDIFFENGINNKYANDKIYYYFDRTSGYNSLSYIPIVLSTNYAHSKLLYIVRDPLTQMYSRFRQFDEVSALQKPKKELLKDEANRRFKQLLDFVTSEPFSDVLMPLLQIDEQSEEIENNIIMWYNTLWSKGGLMFKEKRIWDVCPYVNILLFVKSSEYINKLNGIKNFKLIQFEWATTNNLLLSSIYIYCWVVFNEIDYGNNCVGKYTKNHYELLDEIMFDWDVLEKNSHFGKLKDYEWNFYDVNTFDKLIEFFNICDKKLVQLIDKYPILLGEFELKLWSTSRNQIRDKMINK